VGGKFPGKLPPAMRVAALVQILTLGLLSVLILTRSRLILPEFFDISRIAIWGVVALFVMGSLLNLTSPSRKERALWGPVNVILLLTHVTHRSAQPVFSGRQGCDVLVFALKGRVMVAQGETLGTPSSIGPCALNERLAPSERIIDTLVQSVQGDDVHYSQGFPLG
jgi:hypothetical protein